MTSNVFAKGDKAPAEYFSGTAWVKMLLQRDPSGSYAIANVEFEAGSRNNWHTHPGGQILIVTEGKGWYQEKGKPAQQISIGEVVIIPANIEHWHGASKDNAMTHLAITNISKDKMVKWLNPVTDEEYEGLKSTVTS
jgi:4-carboxymuconolactone decarboxylase